MNNLLTIPILQFSSCDADIFSKNIYYIEISCYFICYANFCKISTLEIIKLTHTEKMQATKTAFFNIHFYHHAIICKVCNNFNTLQLEADLSFDKIDKLIVIDIFR